VDKTLNQALDELVSAAKRVEFWQTHGSHGDDNLANAKNELSAARRRVYTAAADHFAH